MQACATHASLRFRPIRRPRVQDCSSQRRAARSAAARRVQKDPAYERFTVATDRRRAGPFGPASPPGPNAPGLQEKMRMTTAVEKMHSFAAARAAGREPFKVRDLALADFGRKEIRLAEQE